MKQKFARRVAALLVCAGPAVAGAQMPGIAVLQNAWTNPGLTAAVNTGFGGGGSAYAGAAAWSPRSGRFQLSLGAGIRTTGESGSGPTAGARVAVPFWTTAGGGLGVAGFAGVGSGRVKGDTTALGDAVTAFQVPVGVAVGYRRMLGSRGISAHVAPFYALWRRNIPEVPATGGDPGSPAVRRTAGLFRVGVGVDVGITRRIGVTGGVELGANGREATATDAGRPGPTGAVASIAASWAFGRR